MKYKQLGNSGLQVSEVCLGTMTWGEQNSEEEAYEQLDYALQAGINFFDTAELYPVPPRAETAGRTEEILGRWAKARGVPREKLIIATKAVGAGMPRNFVVANRSVPADPGADCPRLTGHQIRDALEGSLRRLQMDFVDLYQLHWPDRYAPGFGSNQYRLERERDYVSFEEQLETVAALMREGKVRHWGLSNETTFGVCKFCETAQRLGLPPPVSIQNDFSLLVRTFEGELAEACSPRHYNIGLLPYGPLAGGALSGKYEGGVPNGSRHQLFPTFQPRYFAPPSLAAAREYSALARSKGLTPTQLALAWCASRWYVASTIIGASTMEQLKENIEAFDIVLDEETLEKVDKIHLRHRNPNLTD